MNIEKAKRFFGEVIVDGINKIYIGNHPSSQMAIVKFNDRCIMQARYQDFYNEFQDMVDLPRFGHHRGLKEIIEKYCMQLKVPFEVINDHKWHE